MTTVGQYRQEIAIAVEDMRDRIAFFTQMIEEVIPDGPEKVSMLAVVRQFTEKVDTIESESILHDEESISKTIAIARYCQQRDKAYRERDWMARILRQTQEDHARPKPSAAELKEKLEQKQAARERDKKTEQPQQFRLFDDD